MRLIRALAVILSATTAIGAVAGALGLVLGGEDVFNDDIWRTARLEVGYGLSGILLLIVVAAPQAVATIGLLRRTRWASAGLLAAGVLLTGWIVVQMYIIEERSFLQVLYLGIGLVEVVLAAVRARS